MGDQTISVVYSRPDRDEGELYKAYTPKILAFFFVSTGTSSVDFSFCVIHRNSTPSVDLVSTTIFTYADLAERKRRLCKVDCYEKNRSSCRHYNMYLFSNLNE